jgi:hypothetical protein
LQAPTSNIRVARAGIDLWRPERLDGMQQLRDLEIIAGVAAQGLRWNADRMEDELAATSAVLLRDHGVML